MKRIWKFVAVVASIAVFAMPAATLSLHCVLMAPLGDNPHHQCHMMGVNPSADQINAAPVNHSCCTVSAAKPESATVPRAPAGSGIVVPLTSVAFLSDLPAVPAADETFEWDLQSPGGPPQAFLCTFLI
jgi:hypothetical protein